MTNQISENSWTSHSSSQFSDACFSFLSQLPLWKRVVCNIQGIHTIVKGKATPRANYLVHRHYLHPMNNNNQNLKKKSTVEGKRKRGEFFLIATKTRADSPLAIAGSPATPPTLKTKWMHTFCLGWRLLRGVRLVYTARTHLTREREPTGERLSEEETSQGYGIRLKVDTNNFTSVEPTADWIGLKTYFCIDICKKIGLSSDYFVCFFQLSSSLS